MKRALILITSLGTLTLTGCGVDGEPSTPEANTKPGISITGTAKVGVAKRS